MFMQVTETTRLAQLIAAERARTNPVPDIAPVYASVETRGIRPVRLVVATRAAVVRVSNSWKLFCRWFSQSLREQSV
jgi:hypothetical protein